MDAALIILQDVVDEVNRKHLERRGAKAGFAGFNAMSTS